MKKMNEDLNCINTVTITTIAWWMLKTKPKKKKALIG